MSLYESGVRQIIDDFLVEESKAVRDYGDYWSASSAGYCMRKTILERLGLPKLNEDPRKQRVFTSGHVFHDWIQQLTKKAGISIAQEVELQDEELMIRGHFDDLILIEEELPDLPYGDDDKGKGGKFDPTRPEQHLILYDYKTVNSRSFMWAKKNGNKMSYFHRMQLGTYMYMLRNGSESIKPNEHTTQFAEQETRSRETKWSRFAYPQLQEARILKIEKDALMMGEQQLFWDDELSREILDYWTTLNKYWNEKKMPPCTCADQEGGFMAKEKWNPFYYNGEPCSVEYYKKWKEGLK